MPFSSSSVQLLLAGLLVFHSALPHFCDAQAAMPAPMCAGNTYDPFTMMCCDTGGGQFEAVQIELPPEALLFAKCCGDMVVDNSTSGCCMQEPFPLSEGVCCGGELQPADPTVMECCGDALFEKSPMAACCGGHTVVDLTEEICCANRVIQVPGTTHTCCGMGALPMAGAERCCGPRSVYDSTSQSCCDEKVYSGVSCPTTAPPTTTPAPTTTPNVSTTATPTANTPIDLSPLAEDPSVPWGHTAEPVFQQAPLI